jgi:hypothetical protein
MSAWPWALLAAIVDMGFQDRRRGGFGARRECKEPGDGSINVGGMR